MACHPPAEATTMPQSKFTLTAFAALTLALTFCADAARVVSAAPAQSETSWQAAAVAMPDDYGRRVASDVLDAGGNAVDAAIAAGFALAVTFPEAGNLGGGGFMLIYMNGEDTFLDYREKAPLAADRDMYVDEQGEIIEGASVIGHLSVGVPGTVAGFAAAHRKFGTLPWKDLVMPAVVLAESGFVVPEKLVGEMMSSRESYAGKTNFNRYFGGLAAGQVHKQPELAATLRRIAASGAGGFYGGETADLIVAEMARGGGLITLADLDRYEAVWREPLRASWRGFEIVSAPPPSSGGFALIQLLKIKDFTGHFFTDVPHNSAQYVHLVAEIEKRVFADRASYLGDPDFVDNRIDDLLSDEYLRSRAAEIDPKEISTDVGAGTGLDRRDTTHYSILDHQGNAVSNTYTLNLSFGSGVVVEGAGFLLNNEMDDFSAKPGVPNAYGVVGSEANEIQPEKRMLSSMTPTLLLQDGEVSMVVGTPGGSTIFTSVFQTIVNIVDFGMSPLEAIDAARFHHQLLPPDLIMYGPSRPLPEETVLRLQDRGYRLEPIWDFGDMQLIVDDGKTVRAASDPRHRGQARILDRRAE